MGNLFKVSVSESLDEIKEVLNKQKTAKGKERMQMLYWLKQEESIQRQTLAKRLNRNESTIYRWLQTYKQSGIEGLLSVKVSCGRTSTIKGEPLNQLKARLSQKSGFAGYGEIQQWLEQTWGLKIPYSTVHRIVRYRLKAKLKVPRPRSKDSDLIQQQDYKKNCPD